ncbi:MAG: hypothetical protein AABY22_33160 [Nanoarchaeota archaeon]
MPLKTQKRKKVIKAWTKLISGDFYLDEIYETKEEAEKSKYRSWGNEKVVSCKIILEN